MWGTVGGEEKEGSANWWESTFCGPLDRTPRGYWSVLFFLTPRIKNMQSKLSHGLFGLLPPRTQAAVDPDPAAIVGATGHLCSRVAAVAVAGSFRPGPGFAPLLN